MIRKPMIYGLEKGFLVESPMKTKFLRVLLLAIMCMASLLLEGCSRNRIPGLVPSGGVLLYEGEPLPWATVTLVPQKSDGTSRGASAMTDAKGRFNIRTLGQNGILPGNYFVSVKKYIRNEGAKTVSNWKENRKNKVEEPIPEEGILDVVSVLPIKYDNPRNSGLEVEIGTKGESNLRIELKD